MPLDEKSNCAGSALNGPTVQRHQTTFFLGHSLRSHYEDVIKEPIPVRLQALAEQLERRAFFDAQ
jgi:anti-sigma factor NepR-like protein